MTEPERVVWEHVPDGEAEPMRMLSTATFDAFGEEATLLTMTMRFPSAKVKDFDVGKYHADVGLQETLDRLVAAVDAAR